MADPYRTPAPEPPCNCDTAKQLRQAVEDLQRKLSAARNEIDSLESKLRRHGVYW